MFVNIYFRVLKNISQAVFLFTEFGVKFYRIDDKALVHGFTDLFLGVDVPVYRSADYRVRYLYVGLYGPALSDHQCPAGTVDVTLEIAVDPEGPVLDVYRPVHLASFADDRIHLSLVSHALTFFPEHCEPFLRCLSHCNPSSFQQVFQRIYIHVVLNHLEVQVGRRASSAVAGIGYRLPPADSFAPHYYQSVG